MSHVFSQASRDTGKCQQKRASQMHIQCPPTSQVYVVQPLGSMLTLILSVLEPDPALYLSQNFSF